MPLTVLTIAGSDPSGGAGIQSDLRTFAAFGMAGLSVIMAITVQSSLGVQAVYPVDAEVVAAQLSALLEDTRPDAVKIGMLGGASQVKAVADVLRRFHPANIVLDPVLASSGGVPLLDAAGRQLLLTELMPLCDLITPNLAEAAQLAGFPVHDNETMHAAGKALLAMGAKVVLVKGGHLPDIPQDWLLRLGSAPLEYQRPRVHTDHSHGTGCLLSSAIAACLAGGEELGLAVSRAKALVTAALHHPVILGQGRGYPDAAEAVRNRDAARDRTHAERLALLHGVLCADRPRSAPGPQCGTSCNGSFGGGRTGYSAPRQDAADARACRSRPAVATASSSGRRSFHCQRPRGRSPSI